jgi:hypothetical protein
VSQPQGLLAVLPGLIGIAQVPQLPGQTAVSAHAGVSPIAHRQVPVRLGGIEREYLQVTSAGCRRFSPRVQGHPHQIMSEHEQCRIALRLRQTEELLPELIPRL